MLEISVIIACFNGAETLAETLASLVIQEWDRSWEIILADNGSTDASVEIFLGLAAARPDGDAGGGRRAQKGKSFALNAIRAARGRSLLFCDADDRVARLARRHGRGARAPLRGGADRDREAQPGLHTRGIQHLPGSAGTCRPRLSPADHTRPHRELVGGAAELRSRLVPMEAPSFASWRLARRRATRRCGCVRPSLRPIVGARPGEKLSRAAFDAARPERAVPCWRPSPGTECAPPELAARRSRRRVTRRGLAAGTIFAGDSRRGAPSRSPGPCRCCHRASGLLALRPAYGTRAAHRAAGPPPG